MQLHNQCSWKPDMSAPAGGENSGNQGEGRSSKRAFRHFIVDNPWTGARWWVTISLAFEVPESLYLIVIRKEPSWRNTFPQPARKVGTRLSVLIFPPPIRLGFFILGYFAVENKTGGIVWRSIEKEEWNEITKRNPGIPCPPSYFSFDYIWHLSRLYRSKWQHHHRHHLDPGKKPLYFKYDNHWTPEGHKIMASGFMNYLDDNFWKKACNWTASSIGARSSGRTHRKEFQYIQEVLKVLIRHGR